MATKRTKEIIRILEEMYPGKIECYLEYEYPYQLLVATILSAQCTDARVNIVTRNLFKKYNSIEAFAYADYDELCEDIKSTGFYRNKAKNIIGCMRKIHEEYQDKVPSDIDQLILLDGVGRKSANVIRGNIYNIPSIVVDTHVKRISKRLGLTSEDDPVKIEYDLMKALPKDYWINWNIKIIAFGRDRCRSNCPKCQECPLVGYCVHQ